MSQRRSRVRNREDEDYNLTVDTQQSQSLQVPEGDGEEAQPDQSEVIMIRSMVRYILMKDAAKEVIEVSKMKTELKLTRMPRRWQHHVATYLQGMGLKMEAVEKVTAGDTVSQSQPQSQSQSQRASSAMPRFALVSTVDLSPFSDLMQNEDELSWQGVVATVLCIVHLSDGREMNEPALLTKLLQMDREFDSNLALDSREAVLKRMCDQGYIKRFQKVNEDGQKLPHLCLGPRAVSVLTLPSVMEMINTCLSYEGTGEEGEEGGVATEYGSGQTPTPTPTPTPSDTPSDTPTPRPRRSKPERVSSEEEEEVMVAPRRTRQRRS